MTKRGVAQPGSAPALGAGFLSSDDESTCKSSRPNNLLNQSPTTEATYCRHCGEAIEPSGGDYYEWTHSDPNQQKCYSAEPRQYCETCGSELCEHSICKANYCGLDDPCQECADREWAEIEAEDNAEFYSHLGWKEVFGESE